MSHDKAETTEGRLARLSRHACSFLPDMPIEIWSVYLLRTRAEPAIAVESGHRFGAFIIRCRCTARIDLLDDADSGLRTELVVHPGGP